MTMLKYFAAGAAVLAMAGCELTKPSDIPLQDKPSVNALEQNPTPSIIYAASQGLLNGFREGTLDLLSSLAHHGREGYYLAVARTVLAEFDDPLLPGDGPGWGSAYNYIRTSNSILNATDIVSGMSDANKAAVRGVGEDCRVLSAARHAARARQLRNRRADQPAALGAGPARDQA
jgi:hypothetical protein